MNISGIDHLVLTVRDIEASVRFYESVLGMEKKVFAAGRVALQFGDQKINLHEYGRELAPRASMPCPGSADVCFRTESTIEEAMAHVRKQGVAIVEGPVRRIGATGPMLSFYFRDPDGNLIEVASRCDQDT